MCSAAVLVVVVTIGEVLAMDEAFAAEYQVTPKHDSVYAVHEGTKLRPSCVLPWQNMRSQCSRASLLLSMMAPSL
jgi:hypothetical protein